MTLRSTTLANAADRRRFVTAGLARPYLNGRNRANVQAQIRRVEHKLTQAFALPAYGTLATRRRAAAIFRWAYKLRQQVELLDSYPTMSETKGVRTLYIVDN
jgi:hypothetical protein